MRTAALVSRTGSIDWLCAPRFDSDACFAALVGYDEHGAGRSGRPRPMRETRQRYRGDTLILETELRLRRRRGAHHRLHAARTGDRCDVVRIVEGLEGRGAARDAARRPLRLRRRRALDHRRRDGAFTSRPAATRWCCARGAVPGREAERVLRLSCTVKKGERMPLQLSWYPSHAVGARRRSTPSSALAATESYWRDWSGRCRYQGRCARGRHALAPHAQGADLRADRRHRRGADHVAARGDRRRPQLGLPLLLAARRQPDARRADDRRLRRRGARVPRLAAARRRRRSRRPPDHVRHRGQRGASPSSSWTGCRATRARSPVRVGNAASGQFQLDVYGEVLSAIYAGAQAWASPAHDRRAGRRCKALHRVRRAGLAAPGRRHLGGARRAPPLHPLEGHGLGRDRSRRARSSRSSAMRRRRGRAMLPHLRALRERIHDEVCERGFNPRVGAFTQSYGSEALDASVLLMPHVGFLPAQRPARRRAPSRPSRRRCCATASCSATAPSTAPTACPAPRARSWPAASGWPTTTPSPAASTRPRSCSTACSALRNHLGLLAEEYDPTLQRQIGNFPQAFSHLALVFTAHIIELAQQGDMKSFVMGETPALLH